jgi:hypothetical protein
MEHFLVLLLVISIRQVYVFELKNKELYGMAFIDSQIYIHQVILKRGSKANV